MHIPVRSVRFTPDNEQNFRMDLEPGYTVYDNNANILETLNPGDIPLFVETGLELHKHRYLFSGPRGPLQRAYDRRISTGTIQGHLDGENGRIGNCVVQKPEYRFIGLV